MIRSRTTTRRRGQGMTEYIVIVGLIALGLLAAVSGFRDQIDRTIQGTDGNGGATGSVEGINRNIANGVPSGPSGTGSFTTRSGNTVSNGNYTSGPNAGQPWDPVRDPR